MIARQLKSVIARELRAIPAVVLLGPRQVGKTTLALEIAKERGREVIYLDLERPADQRKLTDPDAYLRAQHGKLVVLDEIHRAPGLFEILRGIIDERRRAKTPNGHFLLLGSAALDLMRQASESLAGRVTYVELSPITRQEFPAKQRRDTLWVRGGFPESLLATNEAASLRWRQGFIRSYLERDVPMFAPRLPAETVGRLWTMLAHAQGSPLNLARLAASLAVSTPAVSRYVDLLVDLLLVRRLRPWSGNLGKRLVRTPKTYLRDSGILHALLELESVDTILGHPIAGMSWEGFVIENLIAAAGPRRTPYYYRTEDGAEIDLVFERGGEVEIAVEIKRTQAPTLTKGFFSARDALKPKFSFLLHSGAETWPLGDGITAISMEQLMITLSATQSRRMTNRD